MCSRSSRAKSFTAFSHISRGNSCLAGLLCGQSKSRATSRNPAKAGPSHYLSEKGRLNRGIFAVPKVAQTDADEAKTLACVQTDTVSERQGDARQFLAR